MEWSKKLTLLAGRVRILTPKVQILTFTPRKGVSGSGKSDGP